jgi:hypothetical protein
MCILPEGLGKELKMMKQRIIPGIDMLTSCAVQAETVLWDGTHSDIANRTSNINSTNNRTGSDTVWNTTDQPIDSDFESVTNRVPVGAREFMHLMIELVEEDIHLTVLLLP